MIRLLAILLSVIITILQTTHSFQIISIHTKVRTSKIPNKNTNRSGRMSKLAASATVLSATPSPLPLKVAVIGAGASGLVTARILLRHGIEPTILEKDSASGGVWSYHPNSSSRPVYRGLRTNLPRELMAYREFPWGGDGTSMSFVTHNEVKDYLKRYAKNMGVEDLIQYQSTVTQLEIMNDEEHREKKDNDNDNDNRPSWPQIRLQWDSSEDEGEPKVRASHKSQASSSHSEIFDAVCICNGHYAAPATPFIPGMEENFHGKIYHSIEYDDPSIFQDKTILCIGGRASGADLAREISKYATKVYLSDTTCPDLDERDPPGHPISEENVAWVPKTTSILPESTASFGPTCKDTPKVDIIIFCSGYDYQFPFINDSSNLDLSAVPGERCVKPLYEQLWHAKYPSLTFLGLQHSVVPFPFFELQAEAVVSQLCMKSGQSTSSSTSWSLPSMQQRMEEAEEDANRGGPKASRIQDTHFLGSYQWDECLKYAKFAGVLDESLQKYIRTNKALYDHSGEQRKSLHPGGPDRYRYNSYVRDDENESFQIYPLHHLLDLEDDDAKNVSVRAGSEIGAV